MRQTDREREQKWQSEEDARTLQRAMEIKDDAARLRRALAVLEEQSRAATKAKLDVAKVLGRRLRS
jgi:hypothetical protein